MLIVIATKFLLKGAVKKLVVQPAITATLSVIPKSGLVDVILMGQSLSFTTSDLLKFGIEKLYERYGEKAIDFQITKLQSQIYQIRPANELAAHFFREYIDEEELLIDLDRVDQYLDLLYDEDMASVEENELELDSAALQILHDLDTLIERAPDHTFITPQRELELIEEVMQKNMDLVDKTVVEKSLNWENPQSAMEEVLMDFPSAPHQVVTDEQAINDILAKFEAEVKHSGRRRQKLT